MTQDFHTGPPTTDFEESDAKDFHLPDELETRDEDEPKTPDEVDKPDPNLKGKH